MRGFVRLWFHHAFLKYRGDGLPRPIKHHGTHRITFIHSFIHLDASLSVPNLFFFIQQLEWTEILASFTFDRSRFYESVKKRSSTSEAFHPPLGPVSSFSAMTGVIVVVVVIVVIVVVVAITHHVAVEFIAGEETYV